MALLNQDVSFHQGDDVVIPFQILEDDEVTPMNITGATFEWAMAYSAGHETAAVSKTSGSGIAITDAPNGRLEVTVDSANTADLPASRAYFHELVMTLTGRTATVSTGLVNLLESQVK